MKRNILLLGAFMMISAAVTFNAYAGDGDDDDDNDTSLPDITGDFDSINRCRCKDNGCYGGNAISLRAACAKSEEAIDCSKYEGSCPK